MNVPFPGDYSRLRGLEIKRASKFDRVWCARLMATSEPWITLRRNRAAARKQLARPASELYLAWKGRRRVGFILLAPFGLAGSPYVATVAVARRERSRGIGSHLLEFAERHFAGCRSLFLLVSSFNLRARKLYRRLGYKRVALLKDYVVDGHSEILLHKNLAAKSAGLS